MIEERLLVILREHASPSGVVTVRDEVLAQETEATDEEVRAGLGRLERAELLRVLSPAPFLVLKLEVWPGKREKAPVSPLSPYSYSSSNNRLNESYRPPEEQLLREILETLGETDPSSFKGAIRNFSPEVIRKALDRVRRAGAIRKNRTALFRFLLTKLS